MKWLADENFPIPAFHVLVASGFDILHIAYESPSISDISASILIKLMNTFNTFEGNFITVEKDRVRQRTIRINQ